MKKLLIIFAVFSCFANAQDLVITNARIIDGTGRVIDSGSVVIDAGRIVSVSEGAANIAGVPIIDANGMTVMPGFIDAHRHIISGDAQTWFAEQSTQSMQAYLDAGYTTLMEGGGRLPGIMELKRRIDAGELTGPRVITSARADPGQYSTEASARARVRELAEAGVEIIKASTTPNEKDILAILVDEAGKYDLEVMVHAVTVPAMLAAVEAGAGKLVHTPHDSFLTAEEARVVAQANIETLSTIGFAVPTFDVYNDDNIPTFRDGNSWPEGILGTGSNAAGEKAVNGRTLWDAGVVYGFGTDTNYSPVKGLSHELRALNLMFSPRDIIKLMGPNTAAFIDMENEIGTLEPGKQADIVFIDGDPLELIFNLLNVKLVLKGGEIVADHRN
ncbi:amidohydrolase family protein [Gammaproteobacteria bacterium]|nr:amidohydrolase family protein [Gammaproteobacteria bacterium]